ncbi:MAG: hypothetical protein A2798_03835 [Candidatus Levybacteria bacterium RIFCSPHIGHO2_01_FULL_37_17]|nr:MAG: hypothetical protein A2798_03835 [Candidatus Levybacteria bacterium RIFCSPHIGHO2_01_FULL_37_17]OGH36598.1 MAG: hypothetical protein A2959_03890 [Candidatus Levybacteria bacterium RIFCSPLOWO2_01_FULL_38_23]
MNPDRKRLWGFGSKEDPKSEFKVSAQGADLIFRWLSIKHQAARSQYLSRLPGVNGDDGLIIAEQDPEDSTINKIITAVLYNPEERLYELKTQYFNEADLPRDDNPLSSILNADSVRNAMEGKMLRLGTQLESLRGSSEFEVETTIEDIKIHYQGSDYIIHNPGKNTPIPLPGICIHTEGDMSDETAEGFEREYAKYAGVLQEVMSVVYKSDFAIPPSETYEIKPQKNLASKLEDAEIAIKERKRALSASGMIDTDEEIQNEIEQKIQLISMPSETFDDIGGNDKAKEELQTIVHALREPQAYARWGTQAPSGLLLFGEPGTGKTMLTKALAHEAGVGIYVVELADVLHSLYGRTERLLNAVFEKARKNAPVVILIDELDALAGNRNQSSEVTSRVVTVLLSNLDGLNERPEGIVVVGTTNRVEAIDPALKRPGRLDMLIEVPLPDIAQRAKIFDLKMKKAEQVATSAGGRKIFDESVDTDQLINATKGFSGADIEEVVRRSLARKVREEMRNQNPTPVNTQDLLSVIQTYETVRKARKLGFSEPSSKK